MTSSVIVTIVIFLGIVVAGGFLLYFMGDLLMSLSNKNKDNETIKNKQQQEQKALEKRVEALEDSDRAKQDPQIAAIILNGGTVEEYNPEEEEKAEETAEETPVETAEETPVEENTEETEEDDDVSEYIAQRRRELMERLAKMQEEAAEEETTEETEETPVDVTEEAEETPVEEEVEEVAEEPVEETAEEETTEETPVEETVESQSEREVRINALAGSTLEELEAKLTEEQEKLKANEKDLRQCKKEYLPLKRVKKTLESDQKKLRRKEALVAKQKVVLYGVNNLADIDEEKAKKLAEDIDLLDGLKLSVANCEEVMAKNEERFPLLERIYNLLTSQNDEIKTNIADIEEAIKIVNGDTSDAGSEE